jgi:tRNA U34 5-methylaminomethyl-2-thiouridine-forming methyltransferase MnmC
MKTMFQSKPRRKHVFIDNGLRYWLRKATKPAVVIFEVGFGTGLNAWLTYQLALGEQLHVTYYSIESYPLQRNVWTQLNYAPQDPAFALMHEAPWNTAVSLDKYFTLHKLHGNLESYTAMEPVDVVYFDAFAPSKQPEMWTLTMLATASSNLAQSGIFVTYCAKGQLKRDLRALGLQIESLPGPPGKKEMTRAVRP